MTTPVQRSIPPRPWPERVVPVANLHRIACEDGENCDVPGDCTMLSLLVQAYEKGRLVNAEPEIVAALEEWEHELRSYGFFPGSIRAEQHARVCAALSKMRPRFSRIEPCAKCGDITDHAFGCKP